MSSFKLDTSKTDLKSQAKSIGALLVILGVVIAIVVNALVGGIMLVAGTLAVIAGFAATE